MINWSIVRGKMHLIHRNDFSQQSTIDSMPQVKVYNSFLSMAHEAKAAHDKFVEFRSVAGDLIQVLGFIWSASKWCVNVDEGGSDKGLDELLSPAIESRNFTKSVFGDMDQVRGKNHVEDNDIESQVSKVLDAFSFIMDISQRSISTFSEESSVMEHLIQGTDRPYFIHERHQKQYTGLKKLAKFVKESNDLANWEYLFPYFEDALDSMSWSSFCHTWSLNTTHNFKKWIDSAIHCTLLHIWVYQSSRSPHFTSDFLEAYVECIQEHMVWLLQQHHCFLTEHAKNQIKIIQDLLRLVLSLFNLAEHEVDWAILSHTQRYVNPAMTKLGASIHSFTIKEVDGEKMKTFEIDNWITQISPALFLPLNLDCLLSNESLIQYAYYCRHFLLRMPTHGNVDQINPLEDQSKFDEDLVFVARVVFYEWSEHHIELEILLNGRVEMVGVLRGLGSIICSSLNNEVPAELNTGLPDLLARFEHVKVQFIRKISRQIVKDLRPKSPKHNLLGFLNFVLEELEEIQTYKFHSVKHLKDQLQTIEKYLLVFRSYVQNVEGNSIKYHSLRELTVRITNAAYDAEYIINAFASGAHHVCCKSFLISDLLKRLNQIKESIISSSSDVLLPSTKLKTDAIRRSSQAPVPPIDVVVGFDVVRNLMMERLASFKCQLDVISVVGMPGIGKSTLAKKVFEDPYMVSHFQLHAWCCVSQDYAKEDLLLCILGTDGNRQMSCEELSLMVHKKLKGRKYLIVLDDIWDLDVYYYLKRFFPDDGNGSRIVLTSRIKSIGDDCNRLELNLLSHDESWNLLKHKVYFKEECPLELCETGKEISRKCGGLPLAVVVVAGIFAKSKKEENAWKDILEKLCIYNDDCEGQRMKALDLSYELLPEHLKPLFLYFGAFPEDSSIRVSKLKRLWIGEGFIRKTRLRSLEDEAEACLMDLIDRSLVMVGQRRPDGSVKSCSVHDLIRDMCIEKAKAEDFMEHTTSIGRKKQSAECLIYQRRVSVSVRSNAEDKCESSPRPSTSDETPPRQRTTHDDLSRLSLSTRLNSLLLFVNGDTDVLRDIVGDQSALENHKMLRVFDMGRVRIPEDWLRSITLPMNLRYLVCNGRSIPSAVFNLWNLETLIFNYLSKVEILVPGEVWKMSKLRHLHIGYILSGFTFCEAAESCTAKLENLQTLSTPTFKGEERKLIERFPNLVKLKCVFDIRGDNSGWPRLESLHQLQSLAVLWLDCRVPCTDPQFSLPPTLKKLSLDNFGLKWKDISIFQRLPKLEILRLQYESVWDEVWEMEDGVFPRLKVLELGWLNIKGWVASAENFPCLENLVLCECGDLEEIPSSFGEIYSLENIQLTNCSHSASESAKRIQQEQVEEFGNDLFKVYVSGSFPPKDDDEPSDDDALIG